MDELAQLRTEVEKGPGLWQRLWPLGVALRLLAAGSAVLAASLMASSTVLTEAASRAETALSQQDYAAAMAAFQTAAAYQPWAERWLVAHLRTALLAGDMDAAARDLSALEARRPLSGGERLWWAAIYAGQGRIDEARAVVEAERAAGFATDAAGVEALAALADTYWSQGDWARARLTLSDLAGTGQIAPPDRYRLGLVQALGAVEDHGLIDPATRTLTVVAQERAPGLPRPVALLQVLEGLASNPVDLGYVRIGVALLNTGENRLAEAALSRALGFRPAYPEATAYLALARARQGKEALGAAEQAVALAPDSPVVQYLAGLVWKEAGRPYYARRHLEAAWSLDPTNPAFAVEIASTHRLEDHNALAEAWLEEAVKQGNDAYEWRLRLAQFYVDEEYKVEEAGLPLAEALAAEQPDDAEAHATLGWAYFVTGDVEAAFVEMDRALALNPNLPRAVVHYGALLESQGRLSEAIDNYARALQLDPDGPFGAFAERALERISEQ